MTALGRILVTGGAGFIGSTFVRWVLENDERASVIVLDKLTYAGNLANLEAVGGDPRFEFVRGDINDEPLVRALAGRTDAIVNFAAESHVDRSIEAPGAFITTDVHGTYVLLEAARVAGHRRYVQVSTDEVYGDIPTGSASELDPVRPRSPYAASKASADLLVQAYHTTYGLSASITRGSNTFGPRQHPEKLIPLFVTNALDDEPLPLYGDGQQVRDWLYVDDHCSAIWLVLVQGQGGEVYNVSAENELTNLELTGQILRELDKPASLVRRVADRPGHDRRYSVSCAKLRSMGWSAQHDLDESLRATIRWYRENPAWWRPIKEGTFVDYYQRQYGERLMVAEDRS